MFKRWGRCIFRPIWKHTIYSSCFMHYSCASRIKILFEPVNLYFYLFDITFTSSASSTGGIAIWYFIALYILVTHYTILFKVYEKIRCFFLLFLDQQDHKWKLCIVLKWRRRRFFKWVIYSMFMSQKSVKSIFSKSIFLWGDKAFCGGDQNFMGGD